MLQVEEALENYSVRQAMPPCKDTLTQSIPYIRRSLDAAFELKLITIVDHFFEKDADVVLKLFDVRGNHQGLFWEVEFVAENLHGVVTVLSYAFAVLGFASQGKAFTVWLDAGYVYLVREGPSYLRWLNIILY